MFEIIKLDYPITRDAWLFGIARLPIIHAHIRHVKMKDLKGLDLNNFGIEQMKILIERTSNLTLWEINELAPIDYSKIQEFLNKSLSQSGYKRG